jgi:cytochrome d ubiquinol oxidase subunit I
MDVLLLSRIQFAFTVMFHYIYPPISIGLSVLLVVMEGLYLKTKNPFYQQMTRFWVRIFGLVFAIGVATGIVMEFEFGTNWSTYSRYVGDVFGSALAAEGIFAFFLESGFLAILLFGWNKVKPVTHFISTLMVCLGAHFSAIWITVANSWQQTPAGFHIVGEGLQARAEIVDFWAMVFNPSSVDRLTHVFIGAWLAGATLVLSVSAYYILKQRHQQFAKRSFSIALAFFFLAAWAQLFSGHESAEGVAKNQPAKLAAFEGHYADGQPADMYLIGHVNDKEQTVTGLKIPGLLSQFLYGDKNAPVTGLSRFPENERPPVNMTFQSFHIMVGVGTALIALATLGVFFWWRGTLFEKRWLMRLFVISVLGPQIANQAGWFAAEIGRQPWIVYGLLRTSDGLSKVVKAQSRIS